MNKIQYLVIFIFLFSYTGISQTNLHLNYNLTVSGKNLSMIVAKINKKENEIGLGIKYCINSLKHPDDQFNSFYRRLYASKPLQHFGIEAFYHKRIINKWETVKPFISYNLQTSYSTTRNRAFLPVSQDEMGEILYKEYIDFFGPYLWIEQSVGVGYNANISDKLYLTSILSFEVLLLNGKDEKRLNTEKFFREFGYFFNFGIGYKFGNAKKRN